MTSRKLNQGSSLIEILVATGVVGLILTAITASLTYSIKLNAEARYRDLATQAASQAMEVIRREKALRSWQGFSTIFFSGGSEAIYCLAALPGIQEAPIAGACDPDDSLDLNVGQNFKRTAYVTTAGAPIATSVSVKIKVYWNANTDNDDASEQCHKQCVELNQTFYQWE